MPTKGKSRITVYIDDRILAAFKAESARKGIGYQTLINEARTLKLVTHCCDAGCNNANCVSHVGVSYEALGMLVSFTSPHGTDSEPSRRRTSGRAAGLQ